MMLDAQRDTELTKLDKLAVQVVNREVQTLTRGLATRIANLEGYRKLFSVSLLTGVSVPQ
jgi:hypothetical protein